MRFPRTIAATTFLVVVIAALVSGTQSSMRYATRAEAIKLFLDKVQYPLSRVLTNSTPYPDVPGTSWYAPYMVAGVEVGLIKPQPKTHRLFPDQVVSRGDLLTMLSFLYYLPEGLPHTFIDVPATATFVPYLGFARDYELFQFPNLVYFEPERLVTTSEVQAVLRALEGKPPVLAENDSSLGFSDGNASIMGEGSPKTDSPDVPLPRSTSGSSFPPSSGITLSPVEIPASSPILVFPDTLEKKKQALLTLVNEERANVQLDPLERNPFLEEAAQKHAMDMQKQGYFGHFSPEGLSYLDRIEDAGYFSSVNIPLCPCAPADISGITQRTLTTPNYVIEERKICKCFPHYTAGENIARGQASPEIVMDEWMASPPHRKAILQSLFRDIGIGIADDVWVLNFGSITFW